MKAKHLRSLKGYELAIEEFLAPWLRRNDVRGALLVGSYATGLAGPASDIDLLIILGEKAQHWQRGNVMVSGFLVEYASYSIPYLKQLQDRDLKE